MKSLFFSFWKLKNNGRTIDFNPYKRNDVELDQQTREEKMVKIKINRWIDLDDRWFSRMAVRRGFLITVDSWRIPDNKKDEKYKVFDTTKWSRSKTKHVLIPIDRSQL